MALDDYLSLGYGRLRALLEGWTPWTGLVAAKNRIWLNSDTIAPFKNAKDDEDFPEVSLGVPSGQLSGYTTDKRYAMGLAAFNPAQSPWTFVHPVQYPLVITTRTVQAATANQLLLETYRAIMAGGPRLTKAGAYGDIGVKMITGITHSPLITSKQVNEQGDPMGSTRIVILVQIGIQFEKQGNVFVTP